MHTNKYISYNYLIFNVYLILFQIRPLSARYSRIKEHSMSISNILKNIKIRSRIQVIVAIPLMVAAVLAGQALMEKYEVLNESTRLQSLVRLAETSSLLVHELQKERGMSAGFIGSKGKNFAAELPEQTKNTDKRHQALTAGLSDFDAKSFGDEMVSRISNANTALSELAKSRDGVAGLSLSIPQMAGYYTGTIGKLLAIAEEMHELTANVETLSRIAAYTAFLQGKERAGIERAMGAGGFGAGKFAPPVYQKFLQMIAMGDTYFSRFVLNTGAVERAAFADALATPEFRAVGELRKIAIDSPANGTADVTAGQWFKTITLKIDVLKTVEDKIVATLTAQTKEMHTEAKNDLILLGGIIGAIFIGTMLAA